MTKRRDHSALLEEAERLGCTARIEHRGKHKAIVVTKGNRSRFVVVGNTPSDWRAERNQIRDLRRTIREMVAVTMIDNQPTPART